MVGKRSLRSSFRASDLGHNVRGICVSLSVWGAWKGFWRRERLRDFKPAKQISVFVCGQQRPFKPFTTCNRLELILASSLLLQWDEEKTRKAFLKHLPNFLCVSRNIFSAAKMLHAEGDSEGSISNWRKVLEKRRNTNEQNQSAPDPCWLLKAACLCLQIDLKTVNNLFSQMIFNHPLKYLCALACAESCPLGFEMATNNRRREKKEALPGKKINKQAKRRHRTVWGWTLLIPTSANANANACLSNM